MFLGHLAGGENSFESALGHFGEGEKSSKVPSEL